MTAAPLDLLLTGATAITGDPATGTLEDAAIGIRDGRIVHLAPASAGLPMARRTTRPPARCGRAPDPNQERQDPP